jgi:para-nitrobenzyl esterase
VFDNLAAPRTYPDFSSPELASASPKDQALADEISSYWVNFARTGNPNGPGLPQWPEVDQLGPNEAMILEAGQSGRGPWLTPQKLDLFSKIYARDVGAR